MRSLGELLSGYSDEKIAQVGGNIDPFAPGEAAPIPKVAVAPESERVARVEHDDAKWANRAIDRIVRAGGKETDFFTKKIE